MDLYLNMLSIQYLNLINWNGHFDSFTEIQIYLITNTNNSSDNSTIQ